MDFPFALPDLGEGIAEAEIIRWHVELGHRVTEGDPLLDVETEKAIVEIPSPCAGLIAGLAVQEGERVAVGTVLVVIEVEGAAGAGAPLRPSLPADDDRPRRPQASPKVRKLAHELGVDIAALDSPAGRPLTEADVRSAAGATAGERRIPLRGARGRLSRHLTQIQQEVPAVTVVEECDFTGLDSELGGVERMAFVLKAVSAALNDVPELNATLINGEVVLHERHDIGLAIQATGTLVVPVVREVDSLSHDALAAEVARLVNGVRGGLLGPTELRDSTFTVTDAGSFGGLFATPLVNAPEVAVLGLHRVDERPVVRAGEIVIRRMGYVSCTFDHRAADGFHAGAFLQRFTELVQMDRLQAGADLRHEPDGGSALNSRPIAVTGSERMEILLELVCEHVAELSQHALPIDVDRDFRDLGLDSPGAVALRNRLAEITGLRLDATLALDHPTAAALAKHLLAELESRGAMSR